MICVDISFALTKQAVLSLIKSELILNPPCADNLDAIHDKLQNEAAGELCVFWSQSFFDMAYLQTLKRVCADSCAQNPRLHICFIEKN